jgi:hypothetical protein
MARCNRARRSETPVDPAAAATAAAALRSLISRLELRMREMLDFPCNVAAAKSSLRRMDDAVAAATIDT